MADGNSVDTSAYSFSDRLLHRMAFAHPVIQRALSEIESDMFAKEFAGASAERPVFVTGLPRAGTTLLLELLYKTGEFATFTYREMPFVLAPLLWASMTKSGRRSGELKERAHGDGMAISFDSPEAFEEVAWISYLGDAYIGERRLSPLTASSVSDEFREAFPKLIRKLAAAQGGSKRYLSKNNANISRIEAINSIFPDATILICLRSPAAHVRSLMTQHERFCDMHASDRFARDYMKWIGHFDFGANFRPIDFAARGDSASGAADVNFWLRYWIDAYAYAAKRAGPNVSLIAYETLLADPQQTLRRVGSLAKLSDIDRFAAGAASLRNPTTTDAPLENADAALLDEAEAAYSRLAKGA